jgi:hypothetical protein
MRVKDNRDNEERENDKGIVRNVRIMIEKS